MKTRCFLAGLIAVSSAMAQSVTLPETSYDFETVAVGVPVTRFPLSLALLNSGSAPLIISSIVANPPDYSLNSTCPASLAPGTGCFIEPTFTPSTSSEIPGTITITDNAPGSPHIITLAGQGVQGEGPVGNLENTAINFGAWGLGSTNPFPAQAVFQNLGGSTLAIDGITISPSDFTITANNCPATLDGGASCTVNFTFTAMNLGTTTGTLSFITESLGSPQVVNLSYTGVSASGPVLSRPIGIFDESLAGPPLVGTPIAPVQGYIVNSGSAPLTISSVAVTASFLEVNDCGSTVAPGASCLLVPSFTPPTNSPVGGSLTITSNDPLSPHVDVLSGFGFSGEGGAPVLSPEILNFQTPAGITSAAQAITLNNTSNDFIDTSLIIVNALDSGTFGETNDCPSDLGPGSQCTITVTFFSNTPGNFIGTISIQDDLGDFGEQDILLAGTTQACTITPDPSSFTFNATGGTSSFQVGTSFGLCTWVATSSSGFINIISGASGTGSGTVSFSVGVNTDFSPRSGTISVGGQVVTILQAGKAENLSVSPNLLTFAASGGAAAPQSITVSSNGPPISVQASVQGDGNWLAVSPASAVTPATFSVSVNASNLAPASYPGSVTFSGNGAAAVTVAVELTVEPPLVATTGVSTLTLVEAGTSLMFSGTAPLLTNFAGGSFTASVTGPAGITVTPSSGSLPALLNVTIDASSLSPASYQGTLAVSIPGGNPASLSIPITFTVPPQQPNQLTVNSSGLTLSLPNASPQASRQVLVSNPGNAAISFQASADQPWIQVSPSSGTTTSLSAVPISIDLNLAGFAPGTYNGNVTVTASTPSSKTSKASGSATAIVIPVQAAVNGAAAGVTLSETGLTFQAVAGGPPPAVQSFQVLTTGTQAVPFQVSSSTLSAGSWLSISGGGNTSNSGAVQVSVNPSGLAAGAYYGLVQVNSPGAPQVVTVVLNVAAGGSHIGAVVEPTGLIFVSTPESPDPAAQTVLITNANTSPIKFVSAAFLDTGSNWFSANPASGQIGPGATHALTVGATPVTLTQTLPAGVYTGKLEIGFDDNTVQTVEVLLVVAGNSPGASSISTTRLKPRAAACSPTKLLPVFSSLGQGFSVPAGWPQTVSVNVVDDCGNAITAGSVTASFSDGDPPLTLASLDTGTWTATWTVMAAASQATITATAQMQASGGQTLKGSASITGSGQANPDVPVISFGGIVNAASFAKNATLAPGALVTLFGSSLSEQTMAAQALPLPKQLGDVSVVIGGMQVPLLYASTGQVNAVLPFELTPNSTQQVILLRGSAVSTPVSITISTATPAIFSADGSGGGQGIVFGVMSDGTQALADAQNPVSAGEAVVIYATGLGALNPAVPDGAAAPTSPLSKLTDPIKVSIGGLPAQVLYAGVVPGFASLYQVNAVVPAGVPSGAAVPVILTIDGQNNPMVTIAVQ